MLFLFVFLVLFAMKNHRLGFTHFECPLYKQLFILNTTEDSEIYIEGYPTGLREGGILYFPPAINELVIQICRSGHCLQAYEVHLQDGKTLVHLPTAKKLLASVGEVKRS